MMIEEYSAIKKDELRDLFLALNWKSGNHPEKLFLALNRMDYYVAARDKDDKLIGLISVLDDGAINAYIVYALVLPEYQHIGIGKKMLSKVLTHYKDFLRIALISYPESRSFYQSAGFDFCNGEYPMEISRL